MWSGRITEWKSGRVEEWKRKEGFVLPFFHSSILPFGGAGKEGSAGA
jgi:hypothetical protein